MMLFDTKKLTALFFILCLGLVVIFYFIVYPVNERTITNFVSLIGSYLSLFGLTIAFIQIMSLKDLAFSTKVAVDENAKRIKQVLSVSELSKAVKIAEQIQIYIQKQNYQLAQLRLKDLKNIVIQATYINEIEEFTNSEEYRDIISKITLDLNNLSDYIAEIKKKINFSVINSNLESISTVLIDLESKLKVRNGNE